MKVQFLCLSVLVIVFSHVGAQAEMRHDMVHHNNQAGTLKNNFEHHHHKQNPAKTSNHTKNQYQAKDESQKGYGVSLMWGDELEEFEPEAQ